MQAISLWVAEVWRALWEESGKLRASKPSTWAARTSPDLGHNQFDGCKTTLSAVECGWRKGCTAWIPRDTGGAQERPPALKHGPFVGLALNPSSYLRFLGPDHLWSRRYCTEGLQDMPSVATLEEFMYQKSWLKGAATRRRSTTRGGL